MNIDKRSISQSSNLGFRNPQSPFSNFPWEFLILLLAALTRFWRLDYHSIWFDEAVSLDWAQRPLGETWFSLLGFVQDKHPPLYYIVLHGWMKLIGLLGLGQRDVALRALGAGIGVLTVWGMLRLCLWTTKRNVALLTGTLVALSPVLVWYSQEVRMFQLATAATIWAAYFLVRAWYGNSFQERIGYWLGMVIALEVALYSYLFSAFVLPAAGIFLLALVLVQRHWREFLEGVVALGIAGGLFLPLALNAWRVGGDEAVPGVPFQDFLANHWRLLRTFTIWRVDWSNGVVLTVMGLFALLLLLGIAAIFAKRNAAHFDPEESTQNSVQNNESWSFGDEPLITTVASGDEESDPNPYRWDFDDDDPLRFLPLIWLAVPLLIANLLLAKDQTIFAEDRYLLFLAPFVLWLIAEGTVWLFNGRPHPNPPLMREGTVTGKTMDSVLSVTVPSPSWGGLGWGFPLTIIAIFAAALPTLWIPALARENWRSAADYILTTQQSNPSLKAAVVAHVDYTHLPLQWYLRKQTTQEQLPLFFPFGGSLSADQMDSTIIPPLQGIVDLGMDTLWLTQSHLDGVDDGHVVEGWLNQNFAVVTEQFPAGIKLSGFALRSIYSQLPQLQENTALPNLELVPGLTLAACEIINPQLQATDERMHPPSGWVHVRLWWQATGTIADNYIASVQMVGAEGVWGDRLYRGNEALRRLPTSDWTVGDIVRDEIDVNLNPVTPAREYPIVVGVRDSADQPAGVTAECGSVKIVE